MRNTERKWATFIYHGPDTNTITKLLSNTNLRRAFKTTNRTGNHLEQREGTTDTYNQSGSYQLKCNECPLKYMGQTGQKCNTLYKKTG
jgi:hypothetical protein